MLKKSFLFWCTYPFYNTVLRDITIVLSDLRKINIKISVFIPVVVIFIEIEVILSLAKAKFLMLFASNLI